MTTAELPVAPVPANGPFHMTARTRLAPCARAAAVSLIVMTMAACSPAPETRSAAAAPPTTAAPLGSAQVGDLPDNPAIADFKAFALNALLIPLLDDAVPPRWLDPFTTTSTSLAIDCIGATVTVDGKPIVPNTPVPSKAFTLRWRLNGCALLNSAVATLTGDVELLVFHDGDHYSASVRPDALQVVWLNGSASLNERFAASTPISPWMPP
jgi:hypothetical protein